MKIKETIERECCQPKDLRPLLSRMHQFQVWQKPKFCVHCGQIHVLTRVYEGGMPESEHQYQPVQIGLS